MSGFLHRLSPRHADALLPAAPLRALATGPAHVPLAAQEELADAAGGPADPLDRGSAQVADTATASHAGSAQASMPARLVVPAQAARGAAQPSAATRAADRPIEPLAAAPGRSRPSPPDAALTGDVPADAPSEPRAERAPSMPVVVPHPSDPAPRVPRPLVRRQAPAPPPLSAATVARLDLAPAAPAPPAIHLHIDRIEVRAAARPAPPAPARPRPPAEPQSLHDYLRGKGRG